MSIVSLMSHLHLRMKPANREVVLAALFLVMVLSVFYERMVWQLWVPFDGDMWTQYFPAKWYVFSFIKQGILPLWTPNLFFGFPIFAEAQAGMLYPLSFPFVFLPTATAFSVTVFIRLFLGGLFTFLYVRSISNHFAGSMLSAIAFACGGYMTAQLRHENVGNALIWLPLILLLLDKWIENLDRRALAGSIVCLGISFLAGYFYISFFILVTASFYYLYRAYHRTAGNRPRLVALRPYILGFLAFGVLSVAVAGVQIVPNYELAQESIRSGGLDYETSTQVSLPPFQMISMLFPKFFGYPPDQNAWGMWSGNFIDLVGYIGILPLLTLTAALVMRRDRSTFFFAGALTISLLLAFGQFSPLWYLVNKLPVFSMMRNPSRFLSIAAFSGAVLAGLGLASLMTNTGSQRARVWVRYMIPACGLVVALSIVSGLLVSGLKNQILDSARWFIDQFVYGRSIHEKSQSQYYDILIQYYDQIEIIATITHPYIYVPVVLLTLSCTTVAILGRGSRWPLAIGLAALILTSADLVLFGHKYNLLMPPDVYDRKEYYIAVMEKDPGIFRYSFAPMSPNPKNYDALRFDEMYVQGHSPIVLRRQTEVIEALRYQASMLHVTSDAPLLNMLNVKYIVTGDSLHQDWAVNRFDEGAKVYENTAALPRAFMVPAGQILPDESAVLSRIIDPDFDPLGCVFLDGSEVKHASSTDWSRAGTAEILRYDIHDVIVEVDSEGGYLVLTDTFFPGWRADVDGADSEILRANYAFRAVELTPGKHRIHFYYQPGSFPIGLSISLVALVFCFGLYIVGPRKAS